MSSAAALPPGAATPSLVSELFRLIRHPEETFPVLFRRGKSGAVLFFSAISGIYVAYAAARGLDLGDTLGFGATAIAVVLVGATLGLIALYFAGGLLSWSAETLRGAAPTERMYAVFGYATWPFLPLLILIVPIELALSGTDLFSAARADARSPIIWILRVLELATIGLWLYLMIKGTGLAARFSEAEAVETLGLLLVELSVILLLLLVILVVAFLI